MKRTVIYEYLAVLVFLLIAIVVGVVRTHNENIEFSKNTTIVVAKITDITGARGRDNLYLRFQFRGKLIETMTTRPSSIMPIYRIGSKVRICVVDSIPEDIRYIDVEQF
jgi:hypothetical protein